MKLLFISLFKSLIILLSLSACTPIVGGNCNYQKTEGTAKIKSITNKKCIVDFYIHKEAGSAWRLQRYLENIEANCLGDVKVGEEYSATYSKAIHGSCTPYFLIVNDNIGVNNEKAIDFNFIDVDTFSK